MLRCCLGAYGRPNHAWMPSLGAGLMRLSQSTIKEGMGTKSLQTEEARGLRRQPALTLLPTFTTSSPLAGSPGL